ncbi:oxygenase MpaB family protein [Dyadobacter fanqingshengii]|uniref:DUF2236 domain-containing protein n=1 Tax=Dyadobacter fanqingshengii TaxID=2906443 RepID=A0A9X1T9I7_9BACT|nr:oxygenase MpaB family protein [Dyadobacter fanqingshengii]MCF0040024.1 DUF2236 domain-containing protein [Dyadobacter fanqingshengii]USJ38224.1 DUF2236 domain-containing protein [Dyadobacter fanqingshengii]
MKWFVKEGSIVREIWGNADTILFIFAGASAEFAVNKSVDWLYFTGKLPADPLGRLFSTVSYARRIVFSEYDAALNAIDQITAIHKQVEGKRGAQIPDWAYRDVLFMLIDYSIRSFEMLERKLTVDERAEVFEVFLQVGARMGIGGLPEHYDSWLEMRNQQLNDNFEKSRFSIDLYKQYKKHLGLPRYVMLKEVQVQLAPKQVNKLLALGQWSALKLILPAYKFTRIFNLHRFVRNLILPEKYKLEIAGLDIASH